MSPLKRAQYIPRRQSGLSLVLVMVILVMVSILGTAAIQLAALGERGARNDRDAQVAWQAAEAALIDAEFDIFGPTASSRRALFGGRPDLSQFPTGCGTAGTQTGLCAAVDAGKPNWLAVDIAGDHSAEYGQFTGRQFSAGGPGLTPARKPRYLIEPVLDPADRDLGSTAPKYIYRVTAIGFGPRPDTRAVIQILYRS